MRGLVEKLRALADPNRASHLGDLWNGLDEAADEIDRLRAELAAERERSARIEKETVERCAQITLVIGCNAHPANHKQYYEACEHVAEVLRHDYAAIRALGEKE